MAIIKIRDINLRFIKYHEFLKDLLYEENMEMIV